MTSREITAIKRSAENLFLKFFSNSLQRLWTDLKYQSERKLGPVYKKFGDNEHVPTTRRFLCVHNIDSNVNRFQYCRRPCAQKQSFFLHLFARFKRDPAFFVAPQNSLCHRLVFLNQDSKRTGAPLWASFLHFHAVFGKNWSIGNFTPYATNLFLLIYFAWKFSNFKCSMILYQKTFNCLIVVGAGH